MPCTQVTLLFLAMDAQDAQLSLWLIKKGAKADTLCKIEPWAQVSHGHGIRRLAPVFHQ
jgi:hypothetical protein